MGGAHGRGGAERAVFPGCVLPPRRRGCCEEERTVEPYDRVLSVRRPDGVAGGAVDRPQASSSVMVPVSRSSRSSTSSSSERLSLDLARVAAAVSMMSACEASDDAWLSSSVERPA